MQRCQLPQCEQGALRSGVEHARRGKADSAMDDSMSDRSHIAYRILLEEGTEHCVEGNRSLLVGQFRMRAGNAARDLRAGTWGYQVGSRRRDDIETSHIVRGQL